MNDKQKIDQQFTDALLNVYNMLQIPIMAENDDQLTMEAKLCLTFETRSISNRKTRIMEMVNKILGKPKFASIYYHNRYSTHLRSLIFGGNWKYFTESVSKMHNEGKNAQCAIEQITKHKDPIFQLYLQKTVQKLYTALEAQRRCKCKINAVNDVNHQLTQDISLPNTNIFQSQPQYFREMLPRNATTTILEQRTLLSDSDAFTDFEDFAQYENCVDNRL